MNLTGVVAVSGKPGLYMLIGQNKSGFILESLDGQKSKLVINMSTAKLASLDDITVYGEDEDIRLKDVFEAIKNYSGTVPQAKDDAKTLRNFFLEVAPTHDTERVYGSDIKKIISWFHVLKDLPLFNEKAEDAAPVAAEVVEEAVEEKPKAAKKTKKAAATKED